VKGYLQMGHAWSFSLQVEQILCPLTHMANGGSMYSVHIGHSSSFSSSFEEGPIIVFQFSDLEKRKKVIEDAYNTVAVISGKVGMTTSATSHETRTHTFLNIFFYKRLHFDSISA
jgi:hypothetical protein